MGVPLSSSLLEAEKVTLFKQRVIAWQEANIESLAFEEKLYVDYVCDRLVTMIDRKVWTGDPKLVSYRYPKSWWTLFQERFMPKWYNDLWPPKYVQRELEVVGYFPDLKLVSKAYNCSLLFRKK